MLLGNFLPSLFFYGGGCELGSRTPIRTILTPKSSPKFHVQWQGKGKEGRGGGEGEGGERGRGGSSLCRTESRSSGVRKQGLSGPPAQDPAQDSLHPVFQGLWEDLTSKSSPLCLQVGLPEGFHPGETETNGGRLTTM